LEPELGPAPEPASAVAPASEPALSPALASKWVAGALVPLPMQLRSRCPHFLPLAYGWTGQQSGSGFINLTPATPGVFASLDRF
jgi:hypothetical protein